MNTSTHGSSIEPRWRCAARSCSGRARPALMITPSKLPGRRLQGVDDRPLAVELPALHGDAQLFGPRPAGPAVDVLEDPSP
ncbi:MAG: hypothetical protein MZV63_60120 [Marinilabiliales bacterium]|nr:hypothetical protein [Marinilabiliales bacterium]